MQNETVWLSQAQMCELFDKDKRTISEHVRNIFAEGEMLEEAVVRNFRTTAASSISHDQALTKAHAEYERFRSEQLSQPSRAEKDFLAAATAVEKLKKPNDML